MNTITIPKKLAGQGDLIIIPRKEYEELVGWKEMMKTFKTFTPTAAEKTSLKKARRDHKGGKYISFNELKRRLGTEN